MIWYFSFFVFRYVLWLGVLVSCFWVICVDFYAEKLSFSTSLFLTSEIKRSKGLKRPIFSLKIWWRSRWKVGLFFPPLSHYSRSLLIFCTYLTRKETCIWLFLCVNSNKDWIFIAIHTLNNWYFMNQCMTWNRIKCSIYIYKIYTHIYVYYV